LTPCWRGSWCGRCVVRGPRCRVAEAESEMERGWIFPQVGYWWTLRSLRSSKRNFVANCLSVTIFTGVSCARWPGASIETTSCLSLSDRERRSIRFT
jgi:hypothetical protein